MSFRKWVESEAIGLVVTAHPTFAMTEATRELILAAAHDAPKKKLKADAIIRNAPPSLGDEHASAQACILTMHRTIDQANEMILAQAAQELSQAMDTN